MIGTIIAKSAKIGAAPVCYVRRGENEVDNDKRKRGKSKQLVLQVRTGPVIYRSPPGFNPGFRLASSPTAPTTTALKLQLRRKSDTSVWSVRQHRLVFRAGRIKLAQISAPAHRILSLPVNLLLTSAPNLSSLPFSLRPSRFRHHSTQLESNLVPCAPLPGYERWAK